MCPQSNLATPGVAKGVALSEGVFQNQRVSEG